MKTRSNGLISHLPQLARAASRAGFLSRTASVPTAYIRRVAAMQIQPRIQRTVPAAANVPPSHTPRIIVISKILAEVHILAFGVSAPVFATDAFPVIASPPALIAAPKLSVTAF